MLEYQLHQYRLIPMLANAIVFRFTIERLYAIWRANQENLMDPRHPNVPYLHALSSVMKSYVSTTIGNAGSELRQAMGGIGYSHYTKVG